jgi:hypothetical protein
MNRRNRTKPGIGSENRKQVEKEWSRFRPIQAEFVHFSSSSRKNKGTDGMNNNYQNKT